MNSVNILVSGVVGRLNNSERAASIIRKGVWIYFLLLLFEGALRKWIVPGLATPLLVVRDPVALVIILTAIRYNLFPANIYVIGLFFIGMVALFTGIFFGHGNFFVALYGARIYIIHFPLIFVIGSVFRREDVENIGKMMLLIAPVMALLIAIQFYSPQSAWVNRGVGGNIEGAGFSGAMGYFRPPGTFSFTNGVSLFFGLLAPYVLFFLFHPGKLPRLIVFVAAAALLIAIPFSISRSLLFSVIISTLFLFVATFIQPRYLKYFIPSLIFLFIVILIFGNAGFLDTAIKAFSSRFESASSTEGGLKGTLGDRYLGGMITALTNNSQELPFWGYGVGMGTNVGSMLLTGKKTFLISEEEWGRMIGEMGILLGLLAIIVRVTFSIKILYYSFKKTRENDLLPWLLASFVVLQLPQGQWAQPTNLGFGILAGGLILSALRTERTI